ncbi:MAG: hypothetical protein EAZ29_12000 [Runella slithyformis]|nr:MAG: hypothetical protein EAZ29_12000 [Runella slithyformis]
MKKVLIVITLMVAAWGVANAQRGNRGYNDNDDESRYDDRRDDRFNNRGSQCDSRYGNPRNRVDEFQRESRWRIADGVARGSISAREARNLLRFAERIERKEQFFWRDGNLDRRERRDLLEDLDRLNREIRHERNDWERSTYDDYGRERERRRW